MSQSMVSLLHDLLIRSAARFPNRECIAQGSRVLTFAELSDEVRQLAQLLVRAGLAPGERVAVHLDKSIQEVTAILGVSMAGGISVNVNSLLKGRQVRHILEDSGASILITSYPRLKSLGSEMAGIGSLRTLIACGNQLPLRDPSLDAFEIIDVSSAAQAGRCEDPVRRIDRDIAAIIYTSGSTGLPKGVVLSHRNLIAGAESVSTYLKNTSEDRILSILPFSFDYGFNQLTTALLVGATLVLKTHLSAGDTLKSLEAERITGLAGIPTLWSQLLQAEWGGLKLPALRYITNSGGKFAEQLVKEYRSRVPHTQIYLMYGLTEAFRSTYLEPEQVDIRPTSIGKAIPNAEILVVDDQGRACGPNEVGELVHRGSHVAMGYWNDPVLTGQRFRRNPLQPAALPVDEWAVFSGDLVRKDEEGYLYFVGRKDHMMKTSGFRVSPTEVEEYFYNTGVVQDVVAFSVPDPVLGEKIKVTLSFRPDVEMGGQELLAMVSRQMPSFMVPKEIQVVDSLPRTSSGKLDRPLVCSSAV
jgi:acyl-CoA ligase (AMP-forming) (exosortase A-associated)